VHVVDDDDAMRRGLKFLISSAGYEVRTYPSAQAFLEACQSAMDGCLVLDVRMPGMDGLELLDHLLERGVKLPVIFITAYGNIPMAVRALKNGAFDFLEKPFEGSELLTRIHHALAQSAQAPARQQASAEIQKRLSCLTPREGEVLRRVVAGMLNKQIAADLGISIKTVENHRAQVMDKMQAPNLAELVRMTILVDSLSATSES
jgi:two-component system response regulator FixJ